MKDLLQIQSELKAPKGQYNSFGKYKYRSCEDILEAAKPICAKYGVILTLSDELVNIGDRYYIKATARITDGEGNTTEVTAYAREEENKKGMDGSQITGTASSYARKYALNGLFLIDDTKDHDSNERRGESREREELGEDNLEPEPSKVWRDKVYDYCLSNGITHKELAKDYKLDKNTTEERFKEVYEHLTRGEANHEQDEQGM